MTSQWPFDVKDRSMKKCERRENDVLKDVASTIKKKKHNSSLEHLRSWGIESGGKREKNLREKGGLKKKQGDTVEKNTF